MRKIRATFRSQARGPAGFEAALAPSANGRTVATDLRGGSARIMSAGVEDD